MKLAVLKEATGEPRCAAIPETVKKFTGFGAAVAIEQGAGDLAGIRDEDFAAAGAKIAARKAVLKDADIILSIDGPDPASLTGARQGALVVGALDPLG